MRSLIYKIRDYFSYAERNLKFIWGISSCSGEASLYQANDIDIVYDKKTKKYMLGVETAFIFYDKNTECDYLNELLGSFHGYMVSKNISVEWEHMFFCSSLTISCEADSIEELYFNFNVYVKGYTAVHKKDI
jgi:hypothetical protein